MKKIKYKVKNYNCGDKSAKIYRTYTWSGYINNFRITNAWFFAFM